MYYYWTATGQRISWSRAFLSKLLQKGPAWLRSMQFRLNSGALDPDLHDERFMTTKNPILNPE